MGLLGSLLNRRISGSRVPEEFRYTAVSVPFRMHPHVPPVVRQCDGSLRQNLIAIGSYQHEPVQNGFTAVPVYDVFIIIRGKTESFAVPLW